MLPFLEDIYLILLLLSCMNRVFKVFSLKVFLKVFSLKVFLKVFLLGVKAMLLSMDSA